MHFEITRVDGPADVADDVSVVDASGVQEIVQQAAATGERLHIRPAD